MKEFFYSNKISNGFLLILNLIIFILIFFFRNVWFDNHVESSINHGVYTSYTKSGGKSNRRETGNHSMG